MSKKNNVNPDHYKIAGRDRPGEDVVHERNKQSVALERARLERTKRGKAERPKPAGSAREEEED
jgi:hypothetical protein